MEMGVDTESIIVMNWIDRIIVARTKENNFL